MSRRNNSPLIAAALIVAVSINDVQGFTVTSTTSASAGACATLTLSKSTSSCLTLHVLAPKNNDGMSLDEMRQAREEELEAMGGDPFFLTDDDLMEEQKEEKPDM
eukprot:150262_1